MDRGRFLKRDSLALTGLGALATAGAYLSVPGGADGELVLYLFFLVWALSPYAAFIFLARRVRRRGGSRTVFLGALVNFALCLTLLADAWSWHTDPQGGVLFITVPAKQWGVFVITVVCWALAALFSPPKVEEELPGDEEQL